MKVEREADALLIEIRRMRDYHALVCPGRTERVENVRDIPERFQKSDFFRLERVSVG